MRTRHTHVDICDRPQKHVPPSLTLIGMSNARAGVCKLVKLGAAAASYELESKVFSNGANMFMQRSLDGTPQSMNGLAYCLFVV